MNGLRATGHTDLPLSTKTLIQTPRTNEIVNLGTGKLIYYGLQKALIEFRLFLLYLGPIIIRTFLSPEERILFNSLHCATRILCDRDQCIVNNQYANDLMIYFVNTVRTLYGDHIIIYNVHNLIHLVRYCLSHGPLDTFSVFIFEDYLQTMKQLVKTGNSPLSQVMNRMAERPKFYPSMMENTKSKFRFIHPMKHSQLPERYSDAHKSIQFLNFSLSNKPSDNCCYLQDGSIIFIEFLGYCEKRAVILGRKMLNPDRIEDYPCDSRLFGICKVHTFSKRQLWPVSETEKKGFAVCYSNDCYVSPILHSDTKF